MVHVEGSAVVLPLGGSVVTVKYQKVSCALMVRADANVKCRAET